MEGDVRAGWFEESEAVIEAFEMQPPHFASSGPAGSIALERVVAATQKIDACDPAPWHIHIVITHEPWHWAICSG